MEYLQNMLKITIAELEKAHDYLRRLKILNAKIEVEMEAYKLRGIELNKANMQILKQVKALKRDQSLEEKLAKLQSKIFEEKQKTLELEEVLAGIKQSHEKAEVCFLF